MGNLKRAKVPISPKGKLGHVHSRDVNTTHTTCKTQDMSFKLTFTVSSYLCFILSTLGRWDKSAAIQELFSFLGI